MMIDLTRSAVVCVAAVVLSFTQLPAAFGGNGCGLVGEICCETDPLCESGTICALDTCVACGGLNEFCCLNEGCDSGLTCVIDLNESVEGKGGGAALGPSICVPCGDQGQPCCDPGTCDSGLVCEPCLGESTADQGGGGGRMVVCPIGASDVCAPCGGLEESCCEGGVCDEGFDCEALGTEIIEQGSGAGAPPQTACFPCGALGLECCDDETCVGDNLICGGELCEACGAIGEQCCANETCPASGGLCVADVCTAVPSVAVMNGRTLLLLILTLTIVAGLWMRRVQA